MKNYIGNISNLIDCNSVIAQCLTHNLEPHHGHMDLDPANEYYNESVEQNKRMHDAGYNDTIVEYRHYQCSKHFDLSVGNQFGKFVDASMLMCWISELRPGRCTPWHWDINPWESEHRQLGKLVRFFCFLSAPKPGHVFVVEDEAFYFEQQGNVYQYPNIHSWHAGTNIGYESKFLLTFTGYR